MIAASPVAGVTTRPQPAAVEDVYLRIATPDDASAIHALIGSHLAEGHLLPRERKEIAVHVHRFTVAVRDARVVACAELAPLGQNVSEVRSLVVSGEARAHGVGHEIIDTLVDRATSAGFEKLCAFTHAPSYFVQLGFSIAPHVRLPEKIATDCDSCTRFRRCGQYAMLRELRPAPQACVPLAALHG